MKFLQYLAVCCFITLNCNSSAQLYALKAPKPLPVSAAFHIDSNCNSSNAGKGTIQISNAELMVVLDSSHDSYTMGTLRPSYAKQFLHKIPCKSSDEMLYNFHFTIPKKQVIHFDELTVDRKNKIALAVLDTMIALQQKYRRYKATEEFDQRELYPDIVWYRHRYYAVEHMLAELCIKRKDANLFNKMIRVNQGNYYYNGDSGEGHHTFAALFFAMPAQMVQLYKNSKEAEVKNGILHTLEGGSLYMYASSYWPQLIIRNDATLGELYASDRAAFDKAIQERYATYISAIKKGLRFQAQ